jgi:hypothetical protein
MPVSKAKYLVLFSPAITLAIWAGFLAVDDWLNETVMIVFLLILAVCVAGAEGVRSYLRRQSRKERERVGAFRGPLA